MSYRVLRVQRKGPEAAVAGTIGRLPLSQKKLPERVSRRDPGGVTHKIGGDSVHAVGVGKGGPRNQTGAGSAPAETTIVGALSFANRLTRCAESFQQAGWCVLVPSWRTGFEMCRVCELSRFES